jgi:hypothetical protein
MSPKGHLRHPLGQVQGRQGRRQGVRNRNQAYALIEYDLSYEPLKSMKG